MTREKRSYIRCSKYSAIMFLLFGNLARYFSRYGDLQYFKKNLRYKMRKCKCSRKKFVRRSN